MVNAYLALAEAAMQVITASDAMENGGRGVPAAERAHLAMVKAEGELLLADALSFGGRVSTQRSVHG